MKSKLNDLKRRGVSLALALAMLCSLVPSTILSVFANEGLTVAITKLDLENGKWEVEVTGTDTADTGKWSFVIAPDIRLSPTGTAVSGLKAAGNITIGTDSKGKMSDALVDTGIPPALWVAKGGQNSTFTDGKLKFSGDFDFKGLSGLRQALPATYYLADSDTPQSGAAATSVPYVAILVTTGGVKANVDPSDPVVLRELPKAELTGSTLNTSFVVPSGGATLQGTITVTNEGNGDATYVGAQILNFYDNSGSQRNDDMVPAVNTTDIDTKFTANTGYFLVDSSSGYSVRTWKSGGAADFGITLAAGNAQSGPYRGTLRVSYYDGVDMDTEQHTDIAFNLSVTAEVVTISPIKITMTKGDVTSATQTGGVITIPADAVGNYNDDLDDNLTNQTWIGTVTPTAGSGLAWTSPAAGTGVTASDSDNLEDSGAVRWTSGTTATITLSPSVWTAGTIASQTYTTVPGTSTPLQITVNYARVGTYYLNDEQAKELDSDATAGTYIFAQSTVLQASVDVTVVVEDPDVPVPNLTKNPTYGDWDTAAKVDDDSNARTFTLTETAGVDGVVTDWWWGTKGNQTSSDFSFSGASLPASFNKNDSFTVSITPAKTSTGYTPGTAYDDTLVIEYSDKADGTKKTVSLPVQISLPLSDYTVTMNANEGTVNSKTVDSFTVTQGNTYGAGLVDAVRANYTFKGWYTEQFADDADLSEKTAVTASDKPTGDITLYAAWESQLFTGTVETHKNGSKEAVSGVSTLYFVPNGVTFNSTDPLTSGVVAVSSSTGTFSSKALDNTKTYTVYLSPSQATTTTVSKASPSGVVNYVTVSLNATDTNVASASVSSGGGLSLAKSGTSGTDSGVVLTSVSSDISLTLSATATQSYYNLTWSGGVVGKLLATGGSGTYTIDKGSTTAVALTVAANYASYTVTVTTKLGNDNVVPGATDVTDVVLVSDSTEISKDSVEAGVWTFSIDTADKAALTYDKVKITTSSGTYTAKLETSITGSAKASDVHIYKITAADDTKWDASNSDSIDGAKPGDVADPTHTVELDGKAVALVPKGCKLTTFTNTPDTGYQVVSTGDAWTTGDNSVTTVGTYTVKADDTLTAHFEPIPIDLTAASADGSTKYGENWSASAAFAVSDSEGLYWTVTEVSKPDWVTIETSSGTGNNDIAVSGRPYMVNDDQVITVTVTSANGTKKQATYKVDVAKASPTFTATPGSGTHYTGDDAKSVFTVTGSGTYYHDGTNWTEITEFDEDTEITFTPAQLASDGKGIFALNSDFAGNFGSQTEATYAKLYDVWDTLGGNYEATISASYDIEVHVNKNGSVWDNAGKTVTLKDNASGSAFTARSYTFTTGDNGSYIFANVPSGGNYELAITADSYSITVGNLTGDLTDDSAQTFDYYDVSLGKGDHGTLASPGTGWSTADGGATYTGTFKAGTDISSAASGKITAAAGWTHSDSDWSPALPPSLSEAVTSVAQYTAKGISFDKNEYTYTLTYGQESWQATIKATTWTGDSPAYSVTGTAPAWLGITADNGSGETDTGVVFGNGTNRPNVVNTTGYSFTVTATSDNGETATTTVVIKVNKHETTTTLTTSGTHFAGGPLNAAVTLSQAANGPYYAGDPTAAYDGSKWGNISTTSGVTATYKATTAGTVISDNKIPNNGKVTVELEATSKTTGYLGLADVWTDVTGEAEINLGTVHDVVVTVKKDDAAWNHYDGKTVTISNGTSSRTGTLSSGTVTITNVPAGSGYTISIDTLASSENKTNVTVGSSTGEQVFNFYTLSVTSTAHGTASASNHNKAAVEEGVYPSGTTYNVATSADTGYHFKDWTATAGTQFTAASYTDNSLTEKTIQVANFEANTVTINVNLNGAGDNRAVALYQSGIKKFGEDSTKNSSGGSVTFSAVPTGDYDIYVGGSTTGKSITVTAAVASGSTNTATLNYYTVKYATLTAASNGGYGASTTYTYTATEVLSGGVDTAGQPNARKITLPDAVPAANFKYKEWTANPDSGAFSVMEDSGTGVGSGTWSVGTATPTAASGIELTPSFEKSAFSISGKVTLYDGANHVGQAYKDVKLTKPGGGDVTVQTDSNGNYTFTGLTATGNYVLECTAVGSGTLTKNVASSDNNADVTDVDLVYFKYSYDLQGGVGTFTGGNVLKGTSYTLDGNEPSKAGYKFMGWNTSASASVDGTHQAKGSSQTMGETANVVWYAIWKATTLTVNVKWNGANDTTPNRAGQIKLATTTTETSTFIAADSVSGGAVTFASGKLAAGDYYIYDDSGYTDLAKITLALGDQQSVTMYYYEVKYADPFTGGTYTGIHSDEVVLAGGADNKVTLPRTTYSDGNVTNKSWSQSAEAGTFSGGSEADHGDATTWTISSSYTGTGAIALTPAYGRSGLPIKVTVTHNGSPVQGREVTLKKDSTTETSVSPHTNVNGEYTFTGLSTGTWTASTYLDAVEGHTASVAATDINKDDYSITLAYYDWTWNQNYDSAANQTGGTVLTGKEYTLPSALTRTGYVFLGWSTNPSATSASAAAGSNQTMGTAATTWYAVWSTNTVTVTAFKNGGKLEGQSIRLKADAGGAWLSAAVTTDANGVATFTGVPVGVYSVYDSDTTDTTVDVEIKADANTASAKLHYWTVSSDTPINGSVTLDGSNPAVLLKEDTSRNQFKATATPDTNYIFGSWEVKRNGAAFSGVTGSSSTGSPAVTTTFTVTDDSTENASDNTKGIVVKPIFTRDKFSINLTVKKKGDGDSSLVAVADEGLTFTTGTTPDTTKKTDTKGQYTFSSLGMAKYTIEVTDSDWSGTWTKTYTSIPDTDENVTMNYYGWYFYDGYSATDTLVGGTASGFALDGTTYSAPTAPTRAGYAFAGWATTKGGAASWNGTGTQTISDVAKWYATWTETKLTVNVYYNGKLDTGKVKTGSIVLSTVNDGSRAFITGTDNGDGTVTFGTLADGTYYIYDAKSAAGFTKAATVALAAGDQNSSAKLHYWNVKGGSPTDGTVTITAKVLLVERADTIDVTATPASANFTFNSWTQDPASSGSFTAAGSGAPAGGYKGTFTAAAKTEDLATAKDITLTPTFVQVGYNVTFTIKKNDAKWTDSGKSVQLKNASGSTAYDVTIAFVDITSGACDGDAVVTFVGVPKDQNYTAQIVGGDTTLEKKTLSVATADVSDGVFDYYDVTLNKGDHGTINNVGVPAGLTEIGSTGNYSGILPKGSDLSGTTVTADAGYKFKNWTGTGTLASPLSTETNITAQYDTNVVEVYLKLNGVDDSTTARTITLKNGGTTINNGVKTGNKITFTAVPALSAGAKYSVDDGSATGVEIAVTEGGTAQATLWYYTIKYGTITEGGSYNSTPSNGEVISNGSTARKQVTLPATTTDTVNGYEKTSWKVDPAAAGDAPGKIATTFTIADNYQGDVTGNGGVVLTAQFTKERGNITVTVTLDGSTVPNGTIVKLKDNAYSGTTAVAGGVSKATINNVSAGTYYIIVDDEKYIGEQAITVGSSDVTATLNFFTVTAAFDTASAQYGHVSGTSADGNATELYFLEKKAGNSDNTPKLFSAPKTGYHSSTLEWKLTDKDNAVIGTITTDTFDVTKQTTATASYKPNTIKVPVTLDNADWDKREPKLYKADGSAEVTVTRTKVIDDGDPYWLFSAVPEGEYQIWTVGNGDLPSGSTAATFSNHTAKIGTGTGETLNAEVPLKYYNVKFDDLKDSTNSDHGKYGTGTTSLANAGGIVLVGGVSAPGTLPSEAPVNANYVILPSTTPDTNYGLDEWSADTPGFDGNSNVKYTDSKVWAIASALSGTDGVTLKPKFVQTSFTVTLTITKDGVAQDSYFKDNITFKVDSNDMASYANASSTNASGKISYTVALKASGAYAYTASTSIGSSSVSGTFAAGNTADQDLALDYYTLTTSSAHKSVSATTPDSAKVVIAGTVETVTATAANGFGPDKAASDITWNEAAPGSGGTGGTVGSVSGTSSSSATPPVYTGSYTVNGTTVITPEIKWIPIQLAGDIIAGTYNAPLTTTSYTSLVTKPWSGDTITYQIKQADNSYSGTSVTKNGVTLELVANGWKISGTPTVSTTFSFGIKAISATDDDNYATNTITVTMSTAKINTVSLIDVTAPVRGEVGSGTASSTAAKVPDSAHYHEASKSDGDKDAVAAWSDGTATTPTEFVYGKRYTVSATLVADEGYEFDASLSGTVVDASDTHTAVVNVTDSTHVTISYTYPALYLVKFDANGGACRDGVTTVPAAQIANVAAGASITLPIALAGTGDWERTNYVTQDGTSPKWSLSQTGSALTSYSVNANDATDGVITLYLVWEIETLVLTPNNGTVKMVYDMNQADWEAGDYKGAQNYVKNAVSASGTAGGGKFRVAPTFVTGSAAMTVSGTAAAFLNIDNDGYVTLNGTPNVGTYTLTVNLVDDDRAVNNSVTEDYTIEVLPILLDHAAINSITAPNPGDTPVTTAPTTADASPWSTYYTIGTVNWTGTMDSGKFKAGENYTAKVVLTRKDANYKFVTEEAPYYTMDGVHADGTGDLSHVVAADGSTVTFIKTFANLPYSGKVTVQLNGSNYSGFTGTLYLKTAGGAVGPAITCPDPTNKPYEWTYADIPYNESYDIWVGTTKTNQSISLSGKNKTINYVTVSLGALDAGLASQTIDGGAGPVTLLTSQATQGSVTVVATKKAAYKFDRWTSSGGTTPTNATTETATFNVSANTNAAITLTATTSKDTGTLSATPNREATYGQGNSENPAGIDFYKVGSRAQAKQMSLEGVTIKVDYATIPDVTYTLDGTKWTDGKIEITHFTGTGTVTVNEDTGIVTFPSAGTATVKFTHTASGFSTTITMTLKKATLEYVSGWASKTWDGNTSTTASAGNDTVFEPVAASYTDHGGGGNKVYMLDDDNQIFHVGTDYDNVTIVAPADDKITFNSPNACETWIRDIVLGEVPTLTGTDAGFYQLKSTYEKGKGLIRRRELETIEIHTITPLPRTPIPTTTDGSITDTVITDDLGNTGGRVKSVVWQRLEGSTWVDATETEFKANEKYRPVVTVEADDNHIMKMPVPTVSPDPANPLDKVYSINDEKDQSAPYDPADKVSITVRLPGKKEAEFAGLLFNLIVNPVLKFEDVNANDNTDARAADPNLFRVLTITEGTDLTGYQYIIDMGNYELPAYDVAIGKPTGNLLSLSATSIITPNATQAPRQTNVTTIMDDLTNTAIYTGRNVMKVGDKLSDSTIAGTTYTLDLTGVDTSTVGYYSMTIEAKADKDAPDNTDAPANDRTVSARYTFILVVSEKGSNMEPVPVLKFDDVKQGTPADIEGPSPAVVRVLQVEQGTTNWGKYTIDLGNTGNTAYNVNVAAPVNGIPGTTVTPAAGRTLISMAVDEKLATKYVLDLTNVNTNTPGTYTMTIKAVGYAVENKYGANDIKTEATYQFILVVKEKTKDPYPVAGPELKFSDVKDGSPKDVEGPAGTVVRVVQTPKKSGTTNLGKYIIDLGDYRAKAFDVKTTVPSGDLLAKGAKIAPMTVQTIPEMNVGDKLSTLRGVNTYVLDLTSIDASVSGTYKITIAASGAGAAKGETMTEASYTFMLVVKDKDIEYQPSVTPVPVPVEVVLPVVKYWISDYGLTNDLTAEKMMKKGDKPSFTPEVEGVDGYTFLGWSEIDPAELKEGEEITLVDPMTFSIEEDKIFYAVYREPEPIPELTVEFRLREHGHSVDALIQTVKSGDHVAYVPEVEPAPRYKFLGWSEIDPQEIPEGEELELVDPMSFVITENKVFYAIYGEADFDHTHYMVGFPDGTFRPDQPITRAEVAAIIARACLEGFVDGSSYGDGGYSDVKLKKWYADEVAFCSEAGVFVGYKDGTFKPEQPITRQELASVVARLAGVQKNEGMPFTDADQVSKWARDSVYTVYTNGWVAGYKDGTFRPKENITRAETVRIFNGYLNRGVNAAGLEGMTPYLLDSAAGGYEGDGTTEYLTWTDVPKKYWAYYDIIEASNDHNFHWPEEENALPEDWDEVFLDEQWRYRPEFDVAFDLGSHGTSATTLVQRVKINGKCKFLPVVKVEDGYTLVGWSESPDGAIVDPLTTPITGEKTYYAVYEEVWREAYIVRYVAGTSGALTGAAVEAVLEGDTPLAIPGVRPVEGYTFLGWSETPGGELLRPIEVKITEDKTFYAVYKKND